MVAHLLGETRIEELAFPRAQLPTAITVLNPLARGLQHPTSIEAIGVVTGFLPMGGGRGKPAMETPPDHVGVQPFP